MTTLVDLGGELGWPPRGWGIGIGWVGLLLSLDLDVRDGDFVVARSPDLPARRELRFVSDSPGKEIGVEGVGMDPENEDGIVLEAESAHDARELVLRFF